MTDQLRQAAQQALEALESSRIFVTTREKTKHPEGTEWYDSAITALRETLAQPEQEPVAFYHPRNGFYWAKPTSIFAPTSVDVERLPLYTAAQRQWLGLTDEEMSDIVADMDVDFGDLLWKVVCLTKIIEATLKELNT